MRLLNIKFTEVLFLTKNLIANGRIDLCDELFIKPSEDCLYIRCYGLQFGFHHIGAKAMAELNPNLINEEGQWDGVRLQPIAEQIYAIAKVAVEQKWDENVIKGRIQIIINQYY